MRNGFSYGVGLAVSLVIAGNFPAIAQGQPENLWDRVYRSLFGGKPPVPKGTGGSRPLSGDDFCSVVPGQWGREKPLMLRSRPTWIWRGAVESIELQVAGQTIWQQSVNVQSDADGLTRILHRGPLLEPGQNYRLVMKRSNNSMVYANFQTIVPELRSPIALAQNRVQESAWRSGKRGSALVQERVSFLTQQELWLEVVQEVLMSGENSAEWRDVRSGIINETCDQ
ncbi:MAG: hypothetical protein RLZZ511_4339 [Cyanobacteriota bacterium]|jgi:hypothetical protein